MPDRAVTAADGPVGNLYAWAVSLIATLMAVGNVALGAVLVAAPQRLSLASFNYITAGRWGGAMAWGAGFTASGLVALFGQYTHRKWPTRVSHSASAIGCVWWVLAFAVAATRSPAAGLTGCVAYGIIGVVHAVVAVVSPHRGLP